MSTNNTFLDCRVHFYAFFSTTFLETAVWELIISAQKILQNTISIHFCHRAIFKKCLYFQFTRTVLNCTKLVSESVEFYTIKPNHGAAFDVFCDQTTAGGMWAVFQKRLDGSVNFNRGWNDYKRGFGNLNGEFWLGLDKINRLTNAERGRLRVNLEDRRKTTYPEYDFFGAAIEISKYKLSLETYSGR